jgi:predicted NodU family carbamoyl transferase
MNLRNVQEFHALNIAGLPIACCAPEDALFTLEKMGHDYLAIGDFLVKSGKSR